MKWPPAVAAGNDGFCVERLSVREGRRTGNTGAGRLRSMPLLPCLFNRLAVRLAEDAAVQERDDGPLCNTLRHAVALHTDVDCTGTLGFEDP